MKLVYGVGRSDANYQVRNPRCPIYETWANMLKRCYYSPYKANKPTYDGCSVVDEWLSFSAFRKWAISQDWEGKCLDKDIIRHNNKVYGPDTCAYIPQELNKLLNGQRKMRGPYPCGVSFHKRDQVFTASVRQGGKQVHLGTFNTSEEAANAFNEAKGKVVEVAALASTHPQVKAGLYRIARAIKLGTFYE